MLRKDLLERLDLITPALASHDLIPILTHFCFTGTEIVAFSDQIGASVPFKSEFRGGVPGVTMLQLLKASKAKDVELLAAENELQIKAASSRFKLPVLSPKSFVFEIPKPTERVLPVPIKQFTAALDGCLRSVTADTSVPDQMGVTLLVEGSDLLLFSTNDATLSFSRLKMSGVAPFKSRVTLPTLFCQQVVALSKALKDVKLEVHDDHAMLTSNRGVVCFGKLIHVEKPVDFGAMAQQSLPKGLDKKLRPIPSKLRLVIERAIVVTASPVEQVMSKISVRDGRMRFVSKSGKGEVVDSVQVDQDEASIELDPKTLKIGFNAFYDQDEHGNGQMLLTDSCFIMARGHDHYLIASQ
jgi:DNA polymerase III sliding clamp (beta) subunit (PCNA family)